MKKSLLMFATMALLAFGVTANAANFKVGVLDMHKIMTDSPQVQKIRANLQKKFQPQQDKFKQARDTFQHDADKLRKDAAVLSKADRETLQKKVVEEQRNLQQEQVAFQQEAVKAQNAAMKTLIDNVRDVAKNIANKKQLNIVITTDAALYFDNTLDITSDVLSKLKHTN